MSGANAKPSSLKEKPSENSMTRSVLSRILWIILVSATLTVMAGAIIVPVLNLIRDDMGLTPTFAGLIITTHALFTAIFSPLIGSIIDRIGVKKPFVFGLILYGVSGSLGLFITSFWLLMISRAILGIAVAAISTSVTVLILNLYKGETRNKVMGWQGSASSFGGIIGPLIGGLFGIISWHMPFAVYMLGIPLGFLALLIVPQIHPERKQDMSKDGSLLEIFKSNRILPTIFGLAFLIMILLYSITVFLPQRLDEINIVNPFYISLFILAMSVSGALTSLVYGRIRSRLSYKTIVLTTLGLWTIGFTMLSQVFFIPLIVVSLVLFGIGLGMLLPTVMVWAGEKVSFSFRGRIISYLLTFGFIGQFSAPIIFGPISISYGFGMVFLIAGISCSVLFVLFLFGLRK